MKGPSKNARYTSVRIQNKLTVLSKKVVRYNIVKAANESNGFSVIANETADLSGTEQLSIGVRFIKLQKQKADSASLPQEFLGLISLERIGVAKIVNIVTQQTKILRLNPDRLQGQGYDGCSTMAGNHNGVQARIKNFLFLSSFRALLFTSTKFSYS